MFQEPAPTRLDLRFTIFSIPVRVHPLFWLMVIFIGYYTNLTELLIWIAIVFISILIHEFGHATAMRMFGWNSAVTLHFFGGLAVPTSSRRESNGNVTQTWMEQVIISLAGPLSQILFVFVALGVIVAVGGVVEKTIIFGFIPVPMGTLTNSSAVVNSMIDVLIFLNVFWALFNLIPIYPLDGAQAWGAIIARFK